MKKIAFAAFVLAACVTEQPEHVLSGETGVVLPVRCLNDQDSGLYLCQDAAHVQYTCTHQDGCGRTFCRKWRFVDPFATNGSGQ